MNILFFQNCISPHQMPYINNLHKIEDIDNVYVIAPEDDMAVRKAMGWDSTNYKNNTKVKLLINADNENIISLFEEYNDTDTWCLFSGINSFPFVTKYFKQSLKFKVKRGIITEPPFLYNHPLWQHAIRFAIKDWKYVKFISKIFVMGDDFLSYYRFWSKKWDVIPFMYCTDWKERSITVHKEDDILKILFVGSLSHRKNVQLLFNAINLLNEEEQEKIEVGIIGEGEEKPNLLKLSRDRKYKTSFYGIIPMNQVSDIMQEYDVLCLPSLHDGWGAVVNEALTLGLYALCSDSCGCKYLIKKSSYTCGNVFENNNPMDLKQKITTCLSIRNAIKSNINNRIEWSKNNIKSDIVAKYLTDNLKK